eukprot:Skav210868  [mRNA]  locus=scaffold4964:78761:82865:- [translate_table: standard]
MTMFIDRPFIKEQLTSSDPGSLRLGLQPLLESLNPVGGVSVTCLDRPIIDLTIKTGTDLIPNLYNFVRDSVDEVIADLIVIPNMVAVPIVYVEVYLGCHVWKSSVAKVSNYSQQVEWIRENVKAWGRDQLVRFRVFSSSSFPSVSGPSLVASGQVFVRDLMPGRVEVPLTDAGQ